MGLGPLDRLAVLLATGFYLSYIPTKLLGAPIRAAPDKRCWTGAGLIGTIEGLALAPLLPARTGRYAVFLALAALAACWLCGRAEKAFAVHDDPRIVLDEVVGYWTAIAFLPPKPSVWLAAFVVFRVLDAVKPPPCLQLERLPGGWGVVADDVGAGIAANLVLRVWLASAPWFGL